MAVLKKSEIKKLGYWKRLCAILGPDPKGEGEDGDEFEFSEDTMDMLRGLVPIPDHAAKDKPLPEWLYLDVNSEVIQDLNGVFSGVASKVTPEHGALIADATKMLEALRLLSREELGDWVYSVRDSASESGDGWAWDRWDHPRVKSWGKACKLTAELVKKHEKFGA